MTATRVEAVGQINGVGLNRLRRRSIWKVHQRFAGIAGRSLAMAAWRVVTRAQYPVESPEDTVAAPRGRVNRDGIARIHPGARGQPPIEVSEGQDDHGGGPVVKACVRG